MFYTVMSISYSNIAQGRLGPSANMAQIPTLRVTSPHLISGSELSRFGTDWEWQYGLESQYVLWSSVACDLASSYDNSIYLFIYWNIFIQDNTFSTKTVLPYGPVYILVIQNISIQVIKRMYIINKNTSYIW